MRKVHVVDYGLGNLFSVARALERVGAEPHITSSYKELSAADRVVLPGVGAFRNGMEGLNSAGLDDSVREFALTERPLLGICLGMQMLASRSYEYGETAGLGILSGEVKPIPAFDDVGMQYKVPFIGWAELEPARVEGFYGSLLAGMHQKDAVYLVHSYQLIPTNSENILCTYRYGAHKITGAVSHNNVTGLQFHPEKSGQVGLEILNRFAFG